MISIYEHDDPPYIEITVSGEYPKDYLKRFETVTVDYASRYPVFGMMETRHGKIDSELWGLLKTGGRISPALFEALKKLKRFAIVTDEPPLSLRLLVMIPPFGGPRMKIFGLHQIDDARAWMRI